jgi:hypothetical protein
MEINMVFTIPSEFRALEKDVAELNLGAKCAVFEKPEKVGEHMWPLFIKGHIDGKPMGRMMIEGGGGGEREHHATVCSLEARA